MLRYSQLRHARAETLAEDAFRIYFTSLENRTRKLAQHPHRGSRFGRVSFSTEKRMPPVTSRLQTAQYDSSSVPETTV